MFFITNPRLARIRCSGHQESTPALFFNSTQNEVSCDTLSEIKIPQYLHTLWQMSSMDFQTFCFVDFRNLRRDCFANNNRFALVWSQS